MSAKIQNKPALLALFVSAAAAAGMTHRHRAATSSLGQQLSGITARLDELERRMLDLAPESSKRVLDRMHELEAAARNQCNRLLQIMNECGREINHTFNKCELLAARAEVKCGNLEDSLRRRADKERQQTTAVHEELRAAIAAIDAQANGAVEKLETRLQQTSDHIDRVQAMVADVRALCTAAEMAAERAQTLAAAPSRQWLGDGVSSQDFKQVVVTRSRSVQPGGPEMPVIIKLAQDAAGRRSPVRAMARSVDDAVNRALARSARSARWGENSRGRSAAAATAGIPHG